MAHEDLLLTLAEIAVTLAALSGVAGILRVRPGQTRMAPFEILLLRNVALIGMVVADGIFLRQVAAPLRSGEFSPGMFSLGLALNVAGATLFGWNVVAPGPGSAQRYVLALMCTLGLAGINFIITALRKPPGA